MKPKMKKTYFYFKNRKAKAECKIILDVNEESIIGGTPGMYSTFLISNININLSEIGDMRYLNRLYTYPYSESYKP